MRFVTNCGNNGEGRRASDTEEIDKLLIHSLADVALKRKAKGLKLNHPEAVAILSAYVLECAPRRQDG